jgi:hypothetical protein
MIRYLKHKEISKQDWDACISESVNRRVYAFSWYLDLVAPGWDALVEDDYRAVFPLTHNRKMGIRYLSQPFFTQQLGLFSRLPLTAGDIARFLDFIPDYFRFAEIQLNAANQPDVRKFSVVMKINHELSLASSHETLMNGCSQNTRRNIRKAVNLGVLTVDQVEPATLVALFRDHFGRKEGVLGARNYLVIRQLIERCLERNEGIVRGACSAAGELCAAAFFLSDGPRIYFLFAASSPAARENGAMFMLLDSFLRDHAGRPVVLDFEGGNDPSLGRFYKSFGAAEVRYPLVTINHLPGLIDMVRKKKLSL